MREITTKRDYEDNVSVTINDNKNCNTQFLYAEIMKRNKALQ